MPSKTPSQQPFLVGRVFELAVCSLAVLISIVAMLQIPFTTDEYDDRLFPVISIVMGSVMVAVVVLLRREAIRLTRYQAKHDIRPGDKTKAATSPENTFFYRWFFIWFLPFAIFLVVLPWIVAGVFTGDDMGPLGVTIVMLVVPWVAGLIGVLVAAIVVFPIETTARGIVKFVRSGGKESTQLLIGLYFMLALAAIVTGVMAVDGIRQGEALGLLLFGTASSSQVESMTMLWVTRGLVALLVIVPIAVNLFAKRIVGEEKLKEIDDKVRRELRS